MSQFFNLTRFGRLLRKHTSENLRSYLMSTAVLAGGVLIVLGVPTYLRHWPLDHEMQLVLFMFGLIAAGGIFTASVFSAVGDPRSAAPMLLLPASHFEKYLIAWLYSLPVFLIVYTSVFMLVNISILQVASEGHSYEVYDFSRGVREWATPLLSYALLQSVVLYGAIYFKRLQVIKTAFLLFGFLVVLSLANRQFMKMLLPDSVPIFPFADVWVGDKSQRAVLALPIDQWQLIMVLGALALATLLWLAAYARLTEKQL
jgi:hypothetical protein